MATELGETTPPRPSLGRWIWGTSIILFAWLIIGSLLTGLTAGLFGLELSALAGSDDQSRSIVASYPPWQAATTLLISFLPLLLAPIALNRFLLKGSTRSIFTKSDRSFRREVGVGALAMVVLLLFTGIPDFLLNNEDYNFTFEPTRFLPYLVVAAILIPIQTTAEEVFFRGWIQQRIENGRRSIWTVSLIGAALFAIPHLGNSEVNGEFLFALVGYGATGFMFAWVTMRDRSIGVAVGAHAANNILAGLVVTSADSTLPSASLWTTPAVAWVPAAVVSVMIIPTFIWLTGRWNAKVAA
jgi:membrane protease YdiL (CAAX protease family)